MATIVASTVAAVVTTIFNRRQAAIADAQKEIASSQRDIAHEKLKADLFDRRFAVYSSLRDGCVHCLRNGRESNMGEVFRMTTPVESATFLFTELNARYLLDLREKLTQYTADCETLKLLRQEDGSYQEFLTRTREGLVSINDALNQLPKQIKDEMGARDVPAARR